jgi:hypothetical protein
MSGTFHTNILRFTSLAVITLFVTSCAFVKSRIKEFSSITTPVYQLTSPATVDDGTITWSKTESPTVTWGASASSETVVDYEVKIGTTQGGSEVKEFTSVGMVLSARFQNLSLTKGVQYFTTVRAKDNTGKYSEESKGDGWYVVQDILTADSTVNTVAIHGTKMYVGGAFSGFGAHSGTFGSVSLTDGQVSLLPKKPVVDGLIYTIESDGSGGFFIGGSFNYVNGISRANLAHILSDGSLNLNFLFDVTGGNVRAIKKVGNTLVVGGYFSNINGTARRRMGSIDLITNTLTSFDPNVDASIYGSDHIATMLYDAPNNTLYVGGRFVSISGVGKNLIAAYDTTNFTIRAGFSAESNNSVTALALDSNTNTLYIGGIFTATNWGLGTQATRNRLAAVNATTGVLTAWDPNASSSITSLAIGGGNLFVAGNFTTFNGGADARNYLASFDLTSGLLNSWNPNSSTIPQSLAVNGSTLYVGSSSTHTYGGTSRPGLAAFDIPSGNLSTTWFPNVATTTYALYVEGSRLFYGHSNSSALANYTTRSRLAAIDLTTGQLTSWNPNITGGNVSTLHIKNNTLYVGGSFTNTDGGATARNRIASYNLATETLTSWNPNASSTVNIITSDSSNLYVGGSFTTMNGGASARQGLASFDLSTGNLSSWNPLMNAGGATNSIHAYNNTLYVGGTFSSFNSGADTRNRLASFNISTGNITSWNPNMSSNVNMITSDSSNLYVGGAFTTVNGGADSRVGLASFNLASGNLNSWNANIASGSVTAVGLDSSNVYIAGSFTTINSDATYIRAAILDKSSAVPNSSWKPSPDNSAVGLIFDSNSVLFFGNALTYNNVQSRYIAPVSISTGLLLQRD